MKKFFAASIISILVFMAVCLVLLGICSLKLTAPTEEITFIASPYLGDKVDCISDLNLTPASAVTRSDVVFSQTSSDIVSEKYAAINTVEEQLVPIVVEEGTVETTTEDVTQTVTTPTTVVTSPSDIKVTGNDNVVVVDSDVEVHQYYSICVDGNTYTLEYSLQDFLYDTCVSYGVEKYYELFLALMFKESSYHADSVSSSDDYGLMQINICNHSTLKELLGVTDFLDPEDSIRCGVYMLSDFLKKYDSIAMALMAYNMGPNGAKRYWEDGIYSTQYTEITLGYLNNNLIAD